MPYVAAVSHKVVSHTLRLNLVVRLARIAYRANVSRSAIVEQAVELLFDVHPRDKTLIDSLRAAGIKRTRRG